MSRSLKIYSALLKLFPARFREEYSSPLEQQFADEYRETSGLSESITLWLRAIKDLAISIPREFSRELFQDLGYTARIYARRPFVTLLVLLTLSIGIGATTGVFSVVNALLLRSLPFNEPQQLVQLWMFPHGFGESPSAFYAWARQSPYLQNAARYDSLEMNVSRVSSALRLRVTETSANFFEMLGTQPDLGRSFSSGEDTPGKNGVAIISYGLWQELFGGDSRVLGATIHVNGIPLAIVGVAQPGFDYPDRTAIWTPTVFQIDRIPKTQIVLSNTIGRMKTGLTLHRAESMFDAELRHIAPNTLKRDEVNRPRLISLRQQLAGPAGQASLVLMGMVAFVLLIACANVANLLLSRTTERRRELAIRAALGASKARLIQQLISESILLALVAAVSGLVIARAVARLLSTLQPAPLTLQNYTILDGRVLSFTIVVALLTGLLFGVFPAFLVGREEHTENLIRRESFTHGSPANRARALLITVQVALTLVLMAGAISMGRGFLKLLGTNLGFTTHNVVTMSVSLAGTRFDSDPNYDSHLREYYREALDHLRSVPGVESAALVDYLPLLAKMFEGADFHRPSGENVGLAVMSAVTPGYFETMGTKILYGRDFKSSDQQGSETPAIINDDFARALHGTSELIGKELIHDWTKKRITIVGIVQTMRMNPTSSGNAQMFLDAERSPRNFMTFVAKVRGRPEPYLTVCREAVQETNLQIPVFGAKTLDQRLADAIAQPRLYTTVVLFFGAFALLLALTGIYGVASYSIAQRTHEIGVRMAVGASARNARGLLMRESLLPVFIGIAIGAAGITGLQRLLEHLMATVPPSNAATWMLALFLLALTAASAVWIATQRIIRLNPVDVLRTE